MELGHLFVGPVVGGALKGAQRNPGRHGTSPRVLGARPVAAASWVEAVGTSCRGKVGEVGIGGLAHLHVPSRFREVLSNTSGEKVFLIQLVLCVITWCAHSVFARLHARLVVASLETCTGNCAHTLRRRDNFQQLAFTDHPHNALLDDDVTGPNRE